MDLRTLNLDDAKTSETFGGANLTSGAYVIDIIKCDKATSQNGATSLNLEIKIGEAKRYVTLWLSSVKDNKIVTNEYDSKRLKQLLILLKIEPKTLTEVPTDKSWLVNIPQIKGSVGAVLEVVPAECFKPNENGNRYPKINIVSFYIASTMQTLKEYTENKTAEIVATEVEKLLAKEYKPYNNDSQNNNQPKQFDTSGTLSESDMPF